MHWSTAKARNGSEWDIFIVAFFPPHEAVHTKHTMFLEGCLICRIWALWSNIYPDLFLFLVYSNLSVLPFHSSILIWFLFVADQRHFPEVALSRWKLLIELKSIMLMQHLSSHPIPSNLPPRLAVCFSSPPSLHQGNPKVLYLCEEMTGLIDEELR